MRATAVIVLCGGRGTRLWPLSRSSTPKYLIELGDGSTLLERTLRRACLLADADHVVVVTSEQHREATARVALTFGVTAIVVEPSARDTTAAAVLGVREIERRWGSCRVYSLPADHDIADGAAWLHAMHTAAGGAADRIVTVGIRPQEPSVEYGYIEAETSNENRLSVVRFHEKPSPERAAAYIDEGFFWNTAMMSFTTDGFLSALGATSQDVIDAVDASGGPGAIDASRWQAVRSVALEHSLMEPAAAAGLVEVVPATFEWRDLGSWAELANVLPSAHSVVCTEGTARVVVAPGATPRRYVIAGVPDVILVDTGDVVLVTTAAGSASLKIAFSLVEAAGWSEVL